ncbi:hypothetical protein D3C84_1056800 [compost metagenome]
MFCPVMKLASSLARNTATRAISSVSHMRPRGTFFSSASMYSSGMPAIIGVLVGPGTRVLTRMPLAASSRAIERVSPITPAFDAQ